MNSGNVVQEGDRDILCWEGHTLRGWIRRRDSEKLIEMLLRALLFPPFCLEILTQRLYSPNIHGSVAST